MDTLATETNPCALQHFELTPEPVPAGSSWGRVVRGVGAAPLRRPCTRGPHNRPHASHREGVCVRGTPRRDGESRSRAHGDIRAADRHHRLGASADGTNRVRGPARGSCCLPVQRPSLFALSEFDRRERSGEQDLPSRPRLDQNEEPFGEPRHDDHGSRDCV